MLILIILNRLLTYASDRRITAEDALKHDWFNETPMHIEPAMFPTWPAKSEGSVARNKAPLDSEPRAPSPGKMFEKLLGDEDGFILHSHPVATGFTLR